MERFIEFEQEISLEEVRTVLEEGHSDIFILRYSKLTGTLKVKVDANMTDRDIRRAFSPFKIRRIHHDFPTGRL